MFRHFRFSTVQLFAVSAIVAKTFTGQVVDKETGTGLSDVSITLQNSSMATSDHDGHFSFTSDVGFTTNRSLRFSNDILEWHNDTRILDLKSAPHITSIEMYTLQGKLLFLLRRSPGSNLLQLPALTNDVYLLRIGTAFKEFFTVKWVYSGSTTRFTLSTRGTWTDTWSKKAITPASLVFSKQEYQNDTVDIKSDSSYTSMKVKMKPVIGSHVFDEDTIRTYKLSITSENLVKLLDFSDLVTNTYTVNSIFVPARLEMEGRILDSVAVRFRGDQSLWDCVAGGKRKTGVKYPQYGFGNGDICAKFSMKFDFNKYNEDNRLYGLKALNFRSMSADPTKMHEKLGFSLFADMGIESPRIAWARLYVNDSLWGLFGIAEEIDGRFTKSHFPKNGDGNLYKEIWPTAQLTESNIQNALTTNNDPEDTPDIANFKRLRDIVKAADTDTGNFLQKVGPLVDIAHLVRYIVVDRAIMNFDGIMICYGGDLRHNYFWYHNETSGLLQLIPWDLDKVFICPEPNFWTNNQPNGKNTVPNWNIVNSSYTAIRCYFDPGSGNTQGYTVTPIDKDKFLRLLRHTTWSDFHNKGQMFLDSTFTTDKINARISRWRSLIARVVGQDPTIDSSEWATMVDSLSHTIPLMRANLKMMIDTLIVR
jgi:spore coat protein CotH